LTVAWPVLAQDGPSFDCAKASTGVEREICRNRELRKADRAMAAAYSALVGKLSGPAREHLIKDQARWIDSRERGCSEGFLEVSECLKLRYEGRVARLRLIAEPGPYPFVSEHAIVQRGRVNDTRYYIDASYPQFDGAMADFSPTNTKFADDAKKTPLVLFAVV
jgi:uncharacterized protein